MSRNQTVSTYARFGNNNGDDDNCILRVAHDDAANPQNAEFIQATADANGPTNQFRKSRGTLLAPGDTVNADRVMDLQSFAYAGTLGFTNIANIRCYVDGALVVNQIPPARLQFETALLNAAPVAHGALFSTGTWAFGNKLVSAGNTIATGLAHFAGENAASGIQVTLQNSSAGGSLALEARNSAGTVAAPANLTNGDNVFFIRAIGYSGGWGSEGASIRYVVDDVVPAANTVALRMAFYTSVASGASAQRMYIRSGGNVGIGNFNPAGGTDAGELLHVRTAGTNTLVWGLQLQNPNNTNNDATAVGILFSSDSNTALAKGAVAYVRDTTDWGRGRFLFMQNTAAAASKPTATDAVMVIENNGAIGMGNFFTPSFVPIAQLHLAGQGGGNEAMYIQMATGNPVIHFRQSNGTLAVPTNSANNDVSVDLDGQTYSGGWFTTGDLRFAVDGAVVNGQAPASRLEVYTNPANGSNTLRLRLNSTGQMLLSPVAGSVTTLSLWHVADSAAVVTTIDQATTDAVSPVTNYRKARGSMSAPSDVTVSDEIFRIQGNARATTYFTMGYLSMVVDAAVVAGQRPASRFEIWTNANNAAAARQLFVDSNGVMNYKASLMTPVALTDAATITVDANLGDFFTVVLGGNRTLGAPSNAASGRKILFRFRQDATGTRVLSFNAAYRFPGGVTPLLSTVAAKTDYLAFVYNAVDSVWDMAGSAFNF